MVLNSGTGQSGFGLIELMVVIAITVAITMTALPLTSRWTNTSLLMETNGVVQQAYTRTKAAAIANPDAVLANDVSAWLCLKNNTVFLHAAPQTKCGISPRWMSRLKDGIQIASGSSMSNESDGYFCIALDKIGLPANATRDGVICSLETEITTKRGDTAYAIQLY
jgi:prepilin-type N-terminal cleavage/methylation domain-containing protein